MCKHRFGVHRCRIHRYVSAPVKCTPIPPDTYPVGPTNALQQWWARTKWNHIQRSEIGIFQFGASTEYISQPRMGRLDLSQANSSP
jgi:hypothetical protein